MVGRRTIIVIGWPYAKLFDFGLRSDLIEDFRKDFDSQSNLEPGKRRPEWKWVSRIKGEWHFNVFVYPALPNPFCKPKKVITRKKAEKEKAWVCQVNN